MRSLRLAAALPLLLLARGASAQEPSHGLVETTSLRLLRDKGVITQGEYDSAMHDIGASTGAAVAGDANTVVLGQWAASLYGFVEADAIYDTTQSFTEVAGNTLVLRPSGAAPPPPASQLHLRRRPRADHRVQRPQHATWASASAHRRSAR